MSSDREMVIKRVINAPRELVFKAWTTPGHLGHWWGPNGFTTTTYNMEFKAGGTWRFVMHGPDGRNYQNKISFIEIVQPERLVYRHGDGSDTELEHVTFQTTVTFTEQNGKTEVTLRAVFPTAEDRDRVVREHGAIEGGKQTLARLDEYVTKPADRAIVSSRVVNAPQKRVYQAFAEPTHLKNWWGPNGFTNTIHEFDLKPGGMWRFIMHGPDGADYRNESRFMEVVPHERIVFEHLKPMHRFEMTLTFESMGDQTRFSFRMVFDTIEECEKVKRFVVDANEQNLDRLEAELSKMA